MQQTITEVIKSDTAEAEKIDPSFDYLKSIIYHGMEPDRIPSIEVDSEKFFNEHYDEIQSYCHDYLIEAGVYPLSFNLVGMDMREYLSRFTYVRLAEALHDQS